MSDGSNAHHDDGLRRIGHMLLRTGKGFGEGDGSQWAAAVAYYALLSLFPLLLAMASIAAYFVDPGWVSGEATRLLGDFLPTGEEQINKIVQGAIESRQVAGIVSIASLLWSGTRIFGALTKAMNRAYDIEDDYGFLRRFLVEALMLLTIGVLFVLALGARLILGPLAQAIGFLPGDGGLLLSILPALASGGLLLLAYLLLYRFVPRRRPDWQAALAGAVVATALVLLGRPLFLYYVRRFGEYNIIYGSLAIVVILIFWAFIVAAITILGAEIASHVQVEYYGPLE